MDEEFASHWAPYVVKNNVTKTMNLKAKRCITTFFGGDKILKYLYFEVPLKKNEFEAPWAPTFLEEYILNV